MGQPAGSVTFKQKILKVQTQREPALPAGYALLNQRPPAVTPCILITGPSLLSPQEFLLQILLPYM